MTYQQLEEHVWSRLGPRKVLVGRKAVADLTRLSIEQWQPDLLVHCGRNSRELEVVRANIADNVKRMYHAFSGYGDAEFGFLWVILFSAIVNAIVWILIQWWFDSSRNRVLMSGWQRDFTK